LPSLTILDGGKFRDRAQDRAGLPKICDAVF